MNAWFNLLRWPVPDGNKLTDEQRENSLQLVMAYRRLLTLTSVYGGSDNIISKSKRELKDQFRSDRDTGSMARFSSITKLKLL